MSCGYFNLRSDSVDKEKQKYIEQLKRITDELNKFQHDAEDALSGMCMSDVGEAFIILRRALEWEEF